MSNCDLLNLNEANLSSANLSGTHFRKTNFRSADLQKTNMGWCMFADVNLASARNLELAAQWGPSTLSHETLFNYARLPDSFLRDCGLPEIFITYYDALRGEAIMFYDTFISYSHKDKDFANRLYERLQAQGVRCWLDAHDLPIGRPIDEGIVEGIRYSGMTILLCSEHSLRSDWVNDELTTTFEEERRLRKENPHAYRLLPIDLDGYIFDEDALEVTSGKVSKIRNRNILPMQDWDDINTDAFNQRVEKLIDALRKDAPDD